MIYNTAGQSIASIYNLGGIFTSGRTYILAIELPTILYISNSYNMATRALADLSPEGAKRPRAINQSSARGAML